MTFHSHRRPLWGINANLSDKYNLVRGYGGSDSSIDLHDAEISNIERGIMNVEGRLHNSKFLVRYSTFNSLWN